MNFVDGCKSIDEVKAVAAELAKQGRATCCTAMRGYWALN